MSNQTLQIDVIGPHEDIDRVMVCNLIVGGRTCTFYTSTSNYEALKYDGFFIRDGKEKDSAGILNTSNDFIEK